MPRCKLKRHLPVSVLGLTMQHLKRLLPIASILLALTFILFAPVRPAAAGCNNFVTLSSITAYRDYIVINYSLTGATQPSITFSVRESDTNTLVGSTTVTNVPAGSYSVEFSLNSALISEMEMLEVTGLLALGCDDTRFVIATGLHLSQATAPQCADGRINFNHCDKIAIFPIKDEGSFGLEVLIVDKLIVPKFATFTSAQELDALPDEPENDILIAESDDGLVQFYKLRNGEYQVNYGPDYESKVFVFRWKGIPAASYPVVETFKTSAYRFGQTTIS